MGLMEDYIAAQKKQQIDALKAQADEQLRLLNESKSKMDTDKTKQTTELTDSKNTQAGNIAAGGILGQESQRIRDMVNGYGGSGAGVQHQDILAMNTNQRQANLDTSYNKSMSDLQTAYMKALADVESKKQGVTNNLNSGINNVNQTLDAQLLQMQYAAQQEAEKQANALKVAQAKTAASSVNDYGMAKTSLTPTQAVNSIKNNHKSVNTLGTVTGYDNDAVAKELDAYLDSIGATDAYRANAYQLANVGTPAQRQQAAKDAEVKKTYQNGLDAAWREMSRIRNNDSMVLDGKAIKGNAKIKEESLKKLVRQYGLSGTDADAIAEHYGIPL